ncbi:MAG: phosphoglucomutase/phosphomannomutase family protein [Acidobacteriota bacterium]
MVKFGTSGWRGIIADDFTFRNVNAVSRAIARYLKDSKKETIRVAVACDTRFLSEKFAETAASALNEEGVHPLILSGFTPTPVISFSIVQNQLAGGLNVTASHNPPEWNGIKFTTERGMPATTEITSHIEKIVEDILSSEEIPEMPMAVLDVETLDPMDAYIPHLETLIDFKAISRSGMCVAIDPFYGTGIRYIHEILKRSDIRYEMIHDRRDVNFGGSAPDPSDKNLWELKKLVVDKKMTLGLALDGDADRFGIIDADGRFVNPNLILGLLTDYLIESRGWNSGVGQTVATGHLMKEAARKNGIPIYVTPVGFKYLGDLISAKKVFIVGEESAGMSIQGHVPEKDGILAVLLVLEMVAKRDKSLIAQRDDLFRKVGSYFNERVNIPVTRDIIERLYDRLKIIPESVAGKKVRELDEMDGVKILLEDDSWILFRKSGTEPIVRLYVEAHSERQLSNLVAEAKRLILED